MVRYGTRINLTSATRPFPKGTPVTLKSEPSSLHVVLGAGPVGRAVATALSADGARVRIVSRSGKAPGLPASVEVRAADLTNAAASLAAVSGAAIVYHCAAPAYHQWVRDFPPLQDSIVAAAAQTGSRLVVVENLYAYGANGVLTEDMPHAATGPKGRLRARMTAKLLAEHQAGWVLATIARASDLLGPEVGMSSLGERFWPPLLQGKPIRWFGDPAAPHSFTYLPDLARAMIRLGAEDAALGRAWHVPSLPPMPVATLAARAADLAGLPAPRITITPKLMMRLIGLFLPAAGEVIEVEYQFTDRFELSSEQYRVAFGGAATDPDTALQATLAWWRAELNLAPMAAAA